MLNMYYMYVYIIHILSYIYIYINIYIYCFRMMDKRFNRVQIDYWTRINGRTRAHTHTRTPHYVYYKRRVCARTKVTRVKNGRQLSIFDVYCISRLL